MTDDKGRYFTFIGDPKMGGRDQTPACDLYGMHFPAGEAVEVKDAETAEKLRRHNHFAEGAVKKQDGRRG